VHTGIARASAGPDPPNVPEKDRGVRPFSFAAKTKNGEGRRTHTRMSKWTSVLLWVANATAHWCYVIIMTNIYKVCCFLRVKQDSIMARLCEPPPSLRQGGCFVNPLISFAHSSPRVQTRRPTTKVQVQLFSARVFHSCVSRQLLLASRVLRLGEEEEEEEDV